MKYEDDNFVAVKVFAGDNSSMLINSRGQLLVAGNNAFNKLGIKDQEIINKFTLITDIQEKIKYVSLGRYHTVLLTETGNIIAMGKNSEGQLGKGNCKTYISPQTINWTNFEIEVSTVICSFLF